MITLSAYDVLVVVDLQHDFLPGGALAVPDGDDASSSIRWPVDSGT